MDFGIGRFLEWGWETEGSYQTNVNIEIVTQLTRERNLENPPRELMRLLFMDGMRI